MSADLHLHTKLSNGSLGIEDLILLAKKRGVTTIAITDHDCLAGTVRGKVIGERHGITVVPGVELSASFFGGLTITDNGKRLLYRVILSHRNEIIVLEIK